MIKIKNLAWASAVSAAIIAIIYDNNIYGQRGSGRFRGGGSVDFGDLDHSAGRYGAADKSAYYRGETTSSGVDLGRSPAPPKSLRTDPRLN